MTDSLRHRGPDDEGFYLSGALGLGIRRLSIIDVAGGHQPISNEAGRIWTVFNGEIFNFPELRSELEGLGHIFRTNADTEVIVHGYEAWGEDVLNHLNGMFGLALWDESTKKLMVARDAMGIKPLYYKCDQESIYFGSEVRAILAAQLGRPPIDPSVVNMFLRYRYVPSPMTMFAGIKKLAPGTMLVVSNGRATVHLWYRYVPRPFSPRKSTREATEELLEIYQRAVKRHLLSDVPVGLFLSGGIDSALLLGLMNAHGERWPTFTIGYDESFNDDELGDADITARIYKSEHTSVRLTRKEFEKSLPTVIGFLEEPVATSSIVPMFYLCQSAREHVKVALMGQGPDELFGGYKRHLGITYGGALRAMPGWLSSFSAAVIRRLPRNEALKRGIASLNVRERMDRYQQVFSVLPSDAVDGMFQDGCIVCDVGASVLNIWRELADLMKYMDELGGFQFLELRSSLPDELLMFGDKLSMAHSLEVRVPYLDREIVEYAQRLDASFKVHLFQQKWLHREVCKQLMPITILKRKKRGFATNVVDQWLKRSLCTKFDGYIRDSDSLMYGMLKPKAVQSLLDEHQNGTSNNYKVLFSLVVLEEWLRIYTSQSCP